MDLKGDLQKRLTNSRSQLNKVERITVLTSPYNFLETKKKYADFPNINVQRLLFTFSDLNASDIEGLMGLLPKDASKLSMTKR